MKLILQKYQEKNHFLVVFYNYLTSSGFFKEVTSAIVAPAIIKALGTTKNGRMNITASSVLPPIFKIKNKVANRDNTVAIATIIVPANFVVFVKMAPIMAKIPPNNPANKMTIGVILPIVVLPLL